MTLTAYHNNPSIKADILAQLQAHSEADEIVKGQYWKGGKGCAVGCTIHGRDHAEYETRFGIPQTLARLEDVIFEGLPNERAKHWPIRFMSAIQPGADLSRVQGQFLHWLLTDETVNSGISHPDVRDAVRQCADLMAVLAGGGTVDGDAAWSAASAASAARATASAAWSARIAASAAESAAYVRMADKLIELIEAAPMAAEAA